MKKIIIIFWLILSISLYGARNEDEEGLPPDVRQEQNAPAGSTRQETERQNTPSPDAERNYQPPAGQTQNSDAPTPRQQEQSERRAFSDILNQMENDRRQNTANNEPDDIQIRWTDNNRRNTVRRRTGQRSEAQLKARLALSHSDILIIKGSGYIDLIVKKKPSVQSILLTTASRNFRTNNSPYSEYVLRSMKPVAENGDERLLYRKKLIGKNVKLYFLVTSSIISHPNFGKAFKIRVPDYVIYGYKWENFGTLRIQDGSRFNIRTFALKHANYRGGYADNVITVDSRHYSGRDFFPPVMKIYRLAETSSYVVIYIEYRDNEKYFKAFYIKDDNNQLLEIVFSRIDEVRDMRALLISSKYDVINKKVVKMKVYIEKMQNIRNITITGEDPSGNQPAIPVTIKIPVKGQNLSTVMQSPQESGTQNPENSNRTSNTESNPRARDDSTPPPMNQQNE